MFNWRSIVNTANALTSPKQAINFLLEKGEKKDPQLAGALRQMINSGENAATALSQLAAEGKINVEQLHQLRKFYTIARKLGLRHQVAESDWQVAEQAIKRGSQPSPKRGGFTGF